MTKAPPSRGLVRIDPFLPPACLDQRPGSAFGVVKPRAAHPMRSRLERRGPRCPGGLVWIGVGGPAYWFNDWLLKVTVFGPGPRYRSISAPRPPTPVRFGFDPGK